MPKINYWGIYADHIEQFVSFKRSLGYKYLVEEKMFAKFDQFTIELGETSVGLSKELSDRWFAKMGNESDSSLEIPIVVSPASMVNRSNLANNFSSSKYL